MNQRISRVWYEAPCTEILTLIQEQRFLTDSNPAPIYGGANHAGDDLAGGEDDTYSF